MMKQNKQIKRRINALVLLSSFLFTAVVLTPVMAHADEGDVAGGNSRADDYRETNGLDGADITDTCENDYFYEFTKDKPTPTTPTQTCEGKVSIEIGSVLELKVDPEELNLIIENGAASGNLTASVKSSRNYTLGISPAKPEVDADMFRKYDSGGFDNNNFLKASVDVQADVTNAWRVRNLTVLDVNTANNGAWTAVTKTETPHIIYKSSIINANTDGKIPGFNAVNFIDTVIPVEMSTKSNLPAGTYETQVTITATQTE